MMYLYVKFSETAIVAMLRYKIHTEVNA